MERETIEKRLVDQIKLTINPRPGLQAMLEIQHVQLDVTKEDPIAKVKGLRSPIRIHLELTK